MLSWLRNILGIPQPALPSTNAVQSVRQRLNFDSLPSSVYAIGDVHGCLNLLLDLESQIAADCATNQRPALVIMLGDYIDRGPDTSSLLDHLLDPPSFNATRICLTGNHEEAMLAFIRDPKRHAAWLEFGGRETLMSYGFDERDLKSEFIKKQSFSHKIHSFIPQDHIDFLRSLPISISFPKHAFVHAGIRPNTPLEKQTDSDLLWIRDEFTNYTDKRDFLVVHGHSPTEKPYASNTRVNVDTGAYATGRLTAAKFTDGELIGFLST